MKLSAEIFQKLKERGLSQIVDSVAELRINRDRCSEIVDECIAINKDVAAHFKKLLIKMLEIRMSQREIVATFKIVKELEFCDENAFSLIFSFKKLDQED